MNYLLTIKNYKGREHIEIGGEAIGSLMDVDIGTEVILFIIEFFFYIYV